MEEKPAPRFERYDSSKEEIDRLKETSLYKVIDNRPKTVEKSHGYETVTNSRIFGNSQQAPKVTFDTKETYEEVFRLSKTHALYTDESKNPIHRFTTTNKRAKSALTNKRASTKDEDHKKEQLNKANFLTAFHKEDCASIKARILKECPITDPYAPQSGIRFRNTQPPVDKPLFNVNTLSLTHIAALQMSATFKSFRNFRTRPTSARGNFAGG